MRSFFSIPNIFSCARIVLTILFLKALLGADKSGLDALLFFTLAAATDMIDGYVARNYDAMTPCGAFLDPLADKFLVFSAFVAFYYKGLVPLWIVVTLLARDIIVTSLRFVLLSSGKPLETTLFAKSKTVAQFGVIYALFGYQFLSAHAEYSDWLPVCNQLVSILLYVVTIITLYSGWEYCAHYLPKKELGAG